MNFEEPCFINKQTPELIEKLKKIGYKITINTSKNPNIITMCNGIVSSISENNVENFIKKLKNNKKSYNDCGTNENLFLALVSLKKYIPINQWFISDENEWFLCEGVLGDKISQNPKKWRKATKEEILEHFK